MAPDPRTPQTPHVRPATPADDRPIAELGDAAWRRAYARLVPPEVIDRLDVETRIARRRERRVTRPDRRSFVAERDGRVAGYVSCGPTADAPGAGELHSLYVHPDHWGAGVGRALFARAADDLVSRGCDTMGLWVLTENARARRFYERRGMVLVIEREDQVLFGRRLAHARYTLELGRQ